MVGPKHTKMIADTRIQLGIRAQNRPDIGIGNYGKIKAFIAEDANGNKHRNHHEQDAGNFHLPAGSNLRL